jgi:L-lactate dehydrogenase complex protein LldG
MVSNQPSRIETVSSAEPSARDAILHAVRAARPPAAERPEPLWPAARPFSGLSRRDTLSAAAAAAGAEVVACARHDLARVLAGTVGGAASILSYTSDATSTISPPADLRQLDTLGVLVCESQLAVAENGAAWIATSDATLRAALFLAARVVIVLAEQHVVDDLHQAYERIDVRAHPFGVFIAGPSKTADIEQALVVGAHGPKELTLVIVTDSTTHDIGVA